MATVTELTATIHQLEKRVRLYRQWARKAEDRGEDRRAEILYHTAHSLKALSADLCDLLPLVM